MYTKKLTKTKAKPKSQIGLTLIEILIALLLGAFLIGGIVQIFVNSRQTYRLQEALSRLQENGRFAMDFIGRDLRMAGFEFCPLPDSSAFRYSAGTPYISGANGVADDPDDASTQDAPDSITVSWREGTNCIASAVPAETSVTYSVASNASGTRELQKNGAPLIQGVENMQILYGVDTNPTSRGRGRPTYFAPADVVAAAGDMPNVVSVRVSLLLYSADEFALDSPASVLFDNAQTVSDRRTRRVFTSTFTLRNRRGRA